MLTLKKKNIYIYTPPQKKKRKNVIFSKSWGILLGQLLNQLITVTATPEELDPKGLQAVHPEAKSKFPGAFGPIKND